MKSWMVLMFAAFALALPANIASASKALPHMHLQWPVCAGMYAPYGWRFDEERQRLNFHGGLDLAGQFGDIVHAAAGGKVVSAELRGPYGLAVEIVSARNVHQRYGHMSALLVMEGETVRADQPIGQVGMTGMASAPHLHFEVWVRDMTRNPLLFLTRSRGCISPWPNLRFSDQAKPPRIEEFRQ